MQTARSGFAVRGHRRSLVQTGGVCTRAGYCTTAAVAVAAGGDPLSTIHRAGGAVRAAGERRGRAAGTGAGGVFGPDYGDGDAGPGAAAVQPTGGGSGDHRAALVIGSTRSV
eukprot:ctg_630.g263